MSLARSSIFRATRVAQASARRAPVVAQATRSFTTSRVLRNAQAVEKEVPVTTYNSNDRNGLFGLLGASTGRHETIPVQETPNIENEADIVEITPLSRAVYDSMPVTMQKTTIMDKTVLLTG